MAENPGQLLTARWWAKKLFGAKWLGSQATLDEYAAATYFEDHHVPYMFQAPFGGYDNELFVDFQILGTAPRIAIEILGDKWHQGRAQIAIDRERIIALEALNNITVVQVWSHSIMKYPGWPYPTWASYERVMEAALRGYEISEAM